VLEALGDLDEAAVAAREATDREKTNWRNWLTLSRIEAERGRAPEAVRAYERAASLNHHSLLFPQGP
jgi:Flp pilus assembly protein TadD